MLQPVIKCLYVLITDAAHRAHDRYESVTRMQFNTRLFNTEQNHLAVRRLKHETAIIWI